MAPRLTPKRWFGILLLASLAWMVLAGRGTGREGAPPSAPEAAQNWVGSRLTTLLIPLEVVATRIQLWFNRLSAGGGPVSADQAQKLLEQRDRLQNQVLNLQSQVAEHERREREAGLIVARGDVRLEDLIEASVIGLGASTATETITLGVGTNHGVKVGAIVVSQLSPVGRVIEAGPVRSTVRLITDADRSMLIGARLLRRSALAGTASRAPDDEPICQVAGTGDGWLRCTSVDATRYPKPPQPGDLLQVEDNDWRPFNGVILGEVVQVGQLANQPLRYDIRIRPAVKVSRVTTVWVKR